MKRRHGAEDIYIFHGPFVYAIPQDPRTNTHLLPHNSTIPDCNKHPERTQHILELPTANMENVTNLASTAATTASKMIFGDKTTEHNETGGQEPISGAQGKGTVDEPYDQGNKGTRNH